MSKLAPSVTIATLESPLVFSGLIDGALTIEGDATIAEGSIFRGQLTARRVVILGTFDGSVTAREALHLGPVAVLIGQARAARLSLDPGAGVEAHIHAGAFEPKAAVGPIEARQVPAALAAVSIQPAQRQPGAQSQPAPRPEPDPRPEPSSAGVPSLESLSAVSLDEVERALAGFEVKLAQIAARSK